LGKEDIHMTKKELPGINLATMIREKMESREPQDTILSCLRQKNGKRLDQRVIKWLQDVTGNATIRLRQSAGMTSIEWGGYTNSGGRSGGSLLCAYSLKNVMIDADFIYEKNLAYFTALWERNGLREELLADWKSLARMETAMKNLRAAKSQYMALLEGEFEVVRYPIEEMLGFVFRDPGSD
jgi:hypothetical protein